MDRRWQVASANRVPRLRPAGASLKRVTGEDDASVTAVRLERTAARTESIRARPRLIGGLVQGVDVEAIVEKRGETIAVSAIVS
jgi:hypothetical protein